MRLFHHHLKNAFIPHEGNDYRPHALRRHMLHWYAGILVASKIIAVSLVAFYAGPARVSDVTPSNIIKQTNIARSANKLSTLKTNALLNKAAQAKANDMIRQQYFAHISPSKVTPWAFFKQAGYSYRYAGENLAIDFAESEDIIQAWLNSPSHRQNLLSSRYTEIGVAVVSGKINGTQSLLVVQMFGTPLKPTVKKSTAASQTPSPTSVKSQLAQKPAVLGEETPPEEPVVTPPVVTPPPEPVAPNAPTIATPGDQSIVQTSKPEIIGTAKPGSSVTVLVNDQVQAIVTANAQGVYQATLEKLLEDGTYAISATATADGLVSPRSDVRRVTVDTAAPIVDERKTYALFSIIAPDTFDVHVVTSPDTTSVNCTCGGATAVLTKDGDAFQGQIQQVKQTSSTSVLGLAIKDVAGNQVNTTLIDTELFTSGAVEPTSGPIVTALRLLLISRGFTIAFLLAMFLLATINIIVHWERQHRPTIVGSLLMIYLAGSLLFI